MSRLACLLLLVILTYQLVVKATDSSIITREEAPSSCVNGHSKRTMFNIIWGCVSTILCAWPAIYPNISAREGPMKRTLRRLELMFWTAVAPEILAAFALNQNLAARTIRDVYNESKGLCLTSSNEWAYETKSGYERKKHGMWKTMKRLFSFYDNEEAESRAWSLTHGYFLIMGAFHLVEPGEGNLSWQEATSSSAHNPTPGEARVTILTLEMLRELVKDPEFEIPTTEDEIMDRSKGDALSKTILLLQSSWFMSQCIVRNVQGLGLSPLELTTLALTSLNGITLILWWDKPLGVQVPVKVYTKRRLTEMERSERLQFESGRRSLPKLFFESCVARIRGIIHCQSEGNIFARFFKFHLAIVALLFFPIIVLGILCVYTIGDLLGASTSFPADATRVPTFYVPRHQYSEWFHAFLLIILATIFGGIHCAGWNFPFPTYPEQKLWRIASLAVITLPIGVFPITVILSMLTFRHSYAPANMARIAVAMILTLMYASARLVLLIQAIALLRHLPPTAFIAIDWTKYYPHIL